MVMPGGLLRGRGAAWRLAECVTSRRPIGAAPNFWTFPSFAVLTPDIDQR
jgi:hypothetical protein